MGDANRRNPQVMSGATHLLPAPFSVLHFRLWRVGKNRQLSNVFQRLLEKLVGLLDRDLRLAGFCLTNGVKPASNRMPSFAHVRVTLLVSLVANVLERWVVTVLAEEPGESFAAYLQ